MSDILGFENKFKESISNLNQTWDEIKKYVDSATAESNTELQKVKSEYSKLQKEYQEAQSKLDHIEAQLAQTVEQMESLSKSNVKGVDAMKLLDVYLVLMEQVFESGPHVRLLLMMHGDKPEYTLNDLVVASGISGIQVRQAMHELRNAGVLTYDDETQVAKLTQRFLN